MPNGSTTKLTSTIDPVSLYVYIVEGVILMILNSSFATLILTAKNLRQQKEYLIFAGDMLFDALFGCMYFLAGIRRLGIFYGEDKYIEAYSRWDCFTVVHTFLFILNTPTSGIMSFLSCFDRFISVTYPTKYLRLTPWYGYSLTFITFASSLPTTIASGIIVYQTKNVYDTNAVCVLQNGVPDFMFFALRGIRIIASCTGTMLYIFIGYKIFRLINPARAETKKISEIKRKRLVTMTLTFLLINLNQLVLFVAPDVVLLLNPSTSFAFGLYVMNLNKGVVNIFIFLLTQKELRRTLAKRLWLASKSKVNFLTESTRTVKPEAITVLVRTSPGAGNTKTMTAIR